LLVDARLSEIADLLAADRLAIFFNDNRLIRFSERRKGRLATAVGIVGSIGMGVTAFRSMTKAPVLSTLQRMYGAATGLDRDRAREDLAFVSDRMAPLVAEIMSGDPAPTVRNVALSLVVAAAQDNRRLPPAVADTWTGWVAATESGPADPTVVRAAATAYVAAWQAELAARSS